MKIEDPNKPRTTKSFALFELGFRPFFLMAGLSALLLMLLWLMVLDGGASVANYYPGIYWHSHEMLFGYVAAVAAGFLLTAVRNWTGIQTLQNTPLALLAILWLLGRLAPLTIFSLPDGVIALIDLSFLPAVVLGITIPLRAKSQLSNYIFPILLLVMAIANGLTHLEFMGFSEQTAGIGISLMLFLLVALIMIMGGRVIPFFSERGVSGLSVRSWPMIEKLAPYSIGAVAIVASILPGSMLLTPVALFAAGVHGVRVYGWYGKKMWSVPMVWILQLGYVWLVIGLFLLALTPFVIFPREFAVHALTAGGIGLVTLGMMARVALGHSGREIETSRLVFWSFVLASLSPLFRVFVPLLMPDWYFSSLIVSGGLWCAAFLLFVFVYLPILIRPRVDGRPG
ncbi:NnrS protein involved in response to NO [hydrothermal vent metagenome]|uniref:NnrS protein involved in response to NO n=1 Tax=hydrothermal vent metagenome TaxID=652676 RepID=A0A3B1C068_9ZZZZ